MLFYIMQQLQVNLSKYITVVLEDRRGKFCLKIASSTAPNAEKDYSPVWEYDAIIPCSWPEPADVKNLTKNTFSDVGILNKDRL